MVGEVEIRPALEADGATIRAMARAARIGPDWQPKTGGASSSGSGRSGPTRATRVSWPRGWCFQSTSGGHRRRIRMRPARVCLANGFCFG
jgi:hypothetical protein